MPGSSTTDLTQLEYEFATNPNSEAFIALAQAYLQKGRYVEAMVVCKRGIKTHPELAAGRFIMASIYRAQAKHQKAIDELNNLLKMHPNFAEAYELLGEVNEKLGKEDVAIQFFKKALDFNPDLQPAREALLKKGIDYQPGGGSAPTEAAAAPAPAASPAPAQERPTEKVMPAAGSAASAAPINAGNNVQTQPAMPAQAARAGSRAAAAPSRPVPAAPPRPAPPRRRIADRILEMEAQQQKPRNRGIKFTLYLAAGLAVVLVVYIIYTWQAGLRQKEINQHLQEGRALFSNDTYAGYQKALEHYRAIIKLDKEHLEALSRAAFICAVLPGEFGGDKALLQEGSKYVQMALATDQTNTMLQAARGLLLVYGGSSLNEARKLLEDSLEQNPHSGLLHATLGLVLLRKGNLSEAREQLEEGTRQPEAMTRALIGLGEYAWRRSMYREAGLALHRALQSNPSHVKATLYLAVNALLWGRSESKNKVARQLLKKFHDKLAANASPLEKAYAELIAAVLEVRNRSTRKAGLAKLNALLKKNSSNALFQFVGARELRRIGHIKAAQQKVALALRLDSSRPDFALEEAAIFLAMKDYEGTRARAMRVQEMDAESGQSALLIGDAYLGEKNFPKAQQYYKEATKFEDTESQAHLKLGDAYMAQSKPDPDRAQAQYELAVPGLTTSGESRLAAQTCVKLGKIYANKDRPKEFINILKTALRADPSYAPPYCLIARNIDLNSKDGRDQAKEYCQKCVKLDNSGKLGGFCRDVLKKLR